MQGWTLLSDGCPDCGVPLLRKAPAPETLCVNCEASFLGGRRLPAPANSSGGGAGGDSALQHEQQQAASDGSAAMDEEDDPTADARLCVTFSVSCWQPLADAWQLAQAQTQSLPVMRCERCIHPLHQELR